MKKTQAEKFVEAAREAGADENVETFRERLKKLVKPPPSKSAKPRKESQGKK